jgi:hypothetical protein
MHRRQGHLRAARTQPPAPDDGVTWDEQGEAQIRCGSGELALWGVAGGPMEEYVHLSAGPGTWRVRICCTGRDEVRRLAQEMVPQGIERYLAQFWPAETQ